MDNVTKLVAKIGAEGSEQTFTGRVAWTLNRLINAGEEGCTPIEYAAPRWSDYVFKLRKALSPLLSASKFLKPFGRGGV